VARELLQSVHSFSLPFRAPRVAEITDAGPGVGIQNRMVPIRDAEIARLRNSDVRVRVHRAPGDPCEAERLNGAISDACVDGSTLEFDFFKRFHDLNDEVCALPSRRVFGIILCFTLAGDSEPDKCYISGL